MAKLTLRLEEFGNTTEKVVENVEVLGDVISYFGEFLKGCGYVYDGQLEIMDCDRCRGRNDTKLSDELDSILDELYTEEMDECGNGKKIYNLATQYPTKEELEAARQKVEDDINQLKFPFGDGY